jgi:alpha-tubulin suppressor-like RCC1 family protein
MRVDTPTVVSLLAHCGTLSVAAGPYCSFAVVGSQVYSWGCNTSGQLMLGYASRAPVTLPAPALDSAPSQSSQELKIVCGLDFTVVVGGGQVWTCGTPDLGQLGREVSLLQPPLSSLQLPLDHPQAQTRVNAGAVRERSPLLPGRVMGLLAGMRATSAACGDHHVLVLTGVCLHSLLSC